MSSFEREALLIAVLVSTGACSSPAKPPPEPWPESSGPNGAPGPSSSAKAGPIEPWNLAGALAHAKVVAPLGPSQHFGASGDGEILADESARGFASLRPGQGLPTGATALERHERAGVIFAMVKRAGGFDPEGGDWEYLVATTDGRVEQRGKLGLCARCHAEAPHDHLFGSGR